MASSDAARGHEATKERILAAALRCFSRLTPERTTISDIARAAGMSRPTIYKYFPTKSDIITEASASRARAISEIVRTRGQSDLNAAQKLEEAIVACVEYIAKDPPSREFFSFSVRDLVVLLGTQEVVLVPGRERWIPILKEGIEDGTFAPDLDIERTVTWISDIQIILSSRHISLGDSIDEIRQYIRSYMLSGILTRG